MPKLGNYCCPRCDLVLRDVVVPFGERFSEQRVICPACRDFAPHPEVLMDYVPAIGRMSAGNGPTFQKFECYDAAGKLVTVDSITALRKIESESEKMARDGVGEGQMVWRDLSNDRSNKYDHAITKNWEPDDYPGTPSKEALARLSALSTEEGRQKVAAAEATAREAAHQSLPPEIP